MSSQHLVWAFREARARHLPTNQRMVLIALAERANGSRFCWPSIPTIADDTGLSEREVYRIIPELRRCKLIRLERREGRPTIYHIAAPEPLTHRQGSTRHTPDSPTGVPPRTPDSMAGVAANNPQPLTLSHPTPDSESETPDSLSPEPVQEPIQEPFGPSDRGEDAALALRKQVFDEGGEIVSRLTGRMNGQARSFVSKLLKEAGHDCTAVLDLLHDAERERPAEPTSWLIAAVRHRSGGRLGIHGEIRRRWKLPTSFLTPVFDDERIAS